MISAIHLDPNGRAWPVVSPGEGDAPVAHGCKRAWRDDALSLRDGGKSQHRHLPVRWTLFEVMPNA